MSIYSTKKDFETFNFDSIALTKPGPIENGNYFIKFLIDNSNLYTQPPKCVTRNGIINVGKKWYIDLMFTNVDEQFIQWVENLESYCVNHIYKNREKWFDSDMEQHDIENYFSTPMKVYKSGKYYILRVNIANHLGKPAIKVYDEEQRELSLDAVSENQQIMSVVEFKGIKCSARSFQIDIELKQLMTIKPTRLFDSCVFGKVTDTPSSEVENTTTNNIHPDKTIDDDESHITINTKNYDVTSINNQLDIEIPDMKEDNEEIPINAIDEIAKINNDHEDPARDDHEEPINNLGISSDIMNESHNESDDMLSEEPIFQEKELTNDEFDIQHIEPDDKTDFEEVTFDLEELPEEDTIVLKNRKDVYYEMYREARRKAKIAKDMAMASYLEAKNIKNTYMLNDIEDSDVSDFEMSDSE